MTPPVFLPTPRPGPSSGSRDWLASDNFASETNDFFSIAHHEIGHALIFNEAHPGFEKALQNGGFTSAAVTNYYGGPVPVDPSNDHLTGVIDPESGQGAFGWEFYGNMPRKRWVMTKIDLLCAQEVGYTLRPTSAFAPFVFATNVLPTASVGIPFTHVFSASGGIPVYDWDIVGGTLPPGLALDSFSGTLAGTPTTIGVFNFTVRVRDYHQNAPGVARSMTLNVTSPPPVRLTIGVAGSGADARAQVHFLGTAGQQQIIETSTNLELWTPLKTNLFLTNIFEFEESNLVHVPQRFYRSVIVP